MPLLFAVLLLGFGKVHIGQHDYKVVITDVGYEDERTIGQFEPDKRLIRIRPYLSLDKAQETLAHEIFIHGCYQETTLTKQKSADEEEVAKSIDGCISDVIRTNPALVKFLQQWE